MSPIVEEAPLSVSPSQMQADSEALAQSRSKTLNWVFALSLLALHVGAIVALFDFRWSSLIVFAVMWVIGQNIGIAMTYHRLLTHRGFIVPRWLEYTMAICATMGLQGGPIYWVAVHRLHHQLTDKPGDPHSPRDGKWWSHVDWILHGSLHNGDKILARYAPDLTRRPFYVWLDRLQLLPITLVGIGLWYFGGWSWVLWGIFLRGTLGLHSTWAVNSATHLWGSRRFDTRDDSRNSWWVALLTGGEGWHNNHHAHPVSAKHGMAWYEVDFNYWGIWLLGAVGLARKIKVQDAKSGPARILHG